MVPEGLWGHGSFGNDYCECHKQPGKEILLAVASENTEAWGVSCRHDRSPALFLDRRARRQTAVHACGGRRQSLGAPISTLRCIRGSEFTTLGMWSVPACVFLAVACARRSLLRAPPMNHSAAARSLCALFGYHGIWRNVYHIRLRYAGSLAGQQGAAGIDA